ncbi:MAG: META domain-containing protein [Mesorhizobium sp.]|uniref:YbaY family lipoprotein n=1 Tax=Mesorhizobium sp. TaxID=1871066 RepID=UPI000FD56B79|nr:YbaY family lipoprotein [Mesorhizobium sp.]RVC60095.1 META domain-containing protein [Mesorhizobium sp. M4B.F.Ca.ET.088.02.2.1]RWF28492.1 MAG: META domain-containing protein [Mesorhizobium sp.]RWF39175.1 MAG: META domain-containing protein [Mesorhizobium sp.]TIX42119.1 MAG: META domain-containing protein [Mesorhizobium sp.]TJW05828.1 MAG: META domain-containing protein [Mesorhizobium sp.]
MLDRIAEFFIFGLVPLVVGVLAVPELTSAAEKTIAGEASYRERIALPPNAVLSVQLADVSLADAPAAIIGERKVAPAGQVPIRFEISFDPQVIRPNMTYALQARITVDDKLLFTTDTRHRVDPLSDRPQSIMLKMVASSDAPMDALLGQSWLIEYIDGIGVIAQPQATFRVGEAGKAGGKGPCNAYFATAKVDGEKIAISEIGSTYMACAPEVMAQEKALFEALAKAASYHIDAGKLIIADKDDRVILRFNAAS